MPTINSVNTTRATGIESDLIKNAVSLENTAKAYNYGIYRIF